LQARRLTCPAFRQLAWEVFDLPAEPGPRQILIRAACSLISAGTELALYTGAHPGFALPNAAWPKLPMPLGDTAAGVVEAVGSQVTEFAAGDRVAAWVAHGDWGVCDLDSTLARPVPAGVTLLGVRQARITLGEAVVVIGLGLVGQFAAQLARLSGARPVIGLDLLPPRLAAAEAHGARPVNPQAEDARQAVAQATAGRMAEVVIEATGNPAAVPLALDLAAEAGRVVLLGSPRGKVEFDAYSTIHRKNIALLGAHTRLGAGVGRDRTPWTHARNVDLLLALLAEGSLRVDDLISHRIPPAAVFETYARLAERPQDFLGVVITWPQT
jgi:threonine dehydrogenase-like Zn-dependent dehydrogenase